ncbi:tetratricopeptide repeat protein [Botrimarina colliarenosi]|uniref:tetratricopeptide repeat protein n=1 Tax=Botrimarina colliarenosi TaxID=2528001 RepID=UPI0011B6972D|nr:tetratricopeptide repeat protein [Botrimarina colliarenosi]
MPRRKPRRHLHWAAYLWPGLPHLWVRGSLAGLTLALAFSVLLNVLVLATLVWPAWLESRLKFACAATAVVLWFAALWETRGELRRLAAERDAADSDEPAVPLPSEITVNDQLLTEAQTNYLRGDWLAAERLLRQAIRRDRDDFEARFWLVSVLRSAGRLRHAERLLRRVERLDAAAAWRHEIADERRRLTAAAPTQPQQIDDEPTILPIATAREDGGRQSRRHAA